MIPDFRGRTIGLVGIFDRGPFPAFARLIRERGGKARRGFRASAAVVAVGARARVADAMSSLEKAEAAGMPCVSERALLRALGMLPKGPEGALDVHEIERHAGLERATVRLLGVLGILDPADDKYSFQDLTTARTAAKAIREGAGIQSIVAGASRLQSVGRTLSNTPVFVERRGGLVIHFRGEAAELDGQMRLPGLIVPAPAIDELLLEADEAEDAGDWAEAERLYRESLKIEPADATLLFGLGNVLREQGRLAEAQESLLKAAAADPNFAEAWYCLGMLAEVRGRHALALACLVRAVKNDSTYVEARMSLARLYFVRERFEDAARQWQACLELGIDEEVARAARRGIHACRVARQTTA